ncbi:MAG: hypothetical protein DRP71_00075 [Verrucomicrobia bacterium]|nr:MAG: hypothetical protein DRP71_00075 [Verrucomicrobiota bacterium]
MRKIFRTLLLSGSLVFLVVVGLLTSVYLVRVRLAQSALERIFGDTGLAEARASIGSITPKSLTISGIVLAGEGWRFELDELRSTHDAWSLSIHEIETGEGRLFVDVDQILETPSKRSVDELADLMGTIQSALPEMDFSVNRIQAELIFMGRRIELNLSGEGSVSSAHQLAVSLEAACGDLSAEIALHGDQKGLVVEIAGQVRGAGFAHWVGQTVPSWRDFLPVDGPFDIDASSVAFFSHLDLSRLHPIAFQAELGVTGLEGCYRDHIVWLDFLDLVVGWTPGEGARFEAVSGGLHLDDGRFEMSVPLGRIVGISGESIVVSSEHAVVETGQVSGAIEFGATIPWPEAGRLPVGTVMEGSIARLTTVDREWKPVDFDLEIEPGLARFHVRRLESLEADWPVLSNLEVNLLLIGGSPDRLDWDASIDLASEPGSTLSVSGEVSNLGSHLVRGSVRVEPSGGRVALKLDRFGSFDTSGGFDLTVEMGDDDRIAAEIGLELEALKIGMDRVDAEIASVTLDLSVPPTPIVGLSQLSGLSPLELFDFVSGLDLKMELIGDRLSLPGEIVLEWFEINHIQGPEWRRGRGDSDLQVSVSAANLRVGGESLHTIEIVQDVTFTERGIRSGGHLKALFDGSLLTGRFEDRLFFGDDGHPVKVCGRVEFEPFEIRHSDLVSRHFSGAAGLSIGAVLSLSAEAWWSLTQPWDLSIGLSVSDGSLTFPPKNLQVEGIEGSLEIASLRDLHVEPEATWGFRRLTASDLVMENGRMVFGFDGTDRLDFVDLAFEVFDGQVRLDPFSYSIVDRTADLQLHVTGLDVGILFEQLDFFEGSFEGSIDGAVPFRIRNGRFIPRQGRLELTPGIPAFFRYRAEGLLTRGEEARSLKDRLRLFPLQLVENGLGNIKVDAFTVDLFDPDFPSSPVRMHLAGKARAEETEIPYFITANINGTVEEALNFLFRLSSL